MQFLSGPGASRLPAIPTPPHIACLEELMGDVKPESAEPGVGATFPGAAAHQGSHDLFATGYGSAVQVSGSVASAAAAAAPSSSTRPQRSKRSGRVAASSAAGSRAASGAKKQPHLDPEGRPISRFKANRLRVKQNLSNMEAAREQMLQELRMLGLENQQLRLKAHALETVVHVRERHVRLLHTCGPPLQQRSEAAVAARALSIHNMNSSGSSQGGGGGCGASSGGYSSQGGGGGSSGSGHSGGWGAVAAGQVAAGGESSWPAPASPVLGCGPDQQQEQGLAAAAQQQQQHGSGQCIVFSGTRAIGSQPMDAATLAASALVAQPLPLPPPAPAPAPAAAPPPAASAAGGRGRRAGSGGRCKGGGAGAAAPPAPPDWPSLLARVLRQVSGFQHPPPPVSAELCKTMPLEQLVACWKCYVADSAALLLELETAPTAAEAATARQRLQSYHETRGFSGLNVFVLNPASVVRVCVLDFEAGGEVDPHQHGYHWAAVLSGLQLTQQQQELFLTLFEMCARDMLAISRQRKELFFSAMGAAAAAAAAGAAAGDGAGAAAAGGPGPPPAAAQAAAAAAAGLAAQVAQQLQQPLQPQRQLGSGGSSPPPSSQLLDTLGRVQSTVSRELLAVMTLNAGFINELLDGEQAARFAVLSWPLFPNTLGVAIALAKAVGWRPKAGPLAKGSITSTTNSSACSQQQPCSSQAAASSGQAQASCGSLAAGATTAQSPPAAAAAAGTGGQRRASARRQSGRLGSQAELPGTCAGVPAAAAAAAAAAPPASSEEEEEDEEPVAMPPDVSDVLSEVQGGRLAAATTILQATEQAVQLGRFVGQPSLALCRALQHGGGSDSLWHAGLP